MKGGSVTARFEELDWCPTPLGELTLRRRRDPGTGANVFEVKLGDEYLMSSAFTVAEVEVARRALTRVAGDRLDVAVGGLGLGYTARAVLADARVRDLVVVEALEPVIRWHERGLVPVGPSLTADPRCRFALGDFFAMAAGAGFDPELPGQLFDAVIVDIDHSPRHLLADGNADFYRVAGTRSLAAHLRPGGAYALWSNDPPDDSYLAVLAQVFPDVAAEVIRFTNPLQEGTATNTVYVASTAAGGPGLAR